MLQRGDRTHHRRSLGRHSAQTVEASVLAVLGTKRGLRVAEKMVANYGESGEPITYLLNVLLQVPHTALAGVPLDKDIDGGLSDLDVGGTKTAGFLRLRGYDSKIGR